MTKPNINDIIKISNALNKKSGEVDISKISEEAKDVIHIVLQLIRYYNLEDELETHVQKI